MLDFGILITAISLFSYAFYKWATLNNDYFEKRNIKHVKPTFLLGSNAGALLNKYTAAEYSQFLYDAFPDDPINGLFQMRTPSYVVRDPAIIKQILVKDFEYFQDHTGFTDDNVDRLWGNALFFLKGEKWRQMRATLSPAFTGSKMRQMFELVDECTDGVVKHYLNCAKNGEIINIEMKNFFARYATDVIASCAFGLKVNSFVEPDNEFYNNGKNLMDFTAFNTFLKMVIVSTMPTIAKLFNITITKNTVARYFHNTIMDTIRYREEKNIFRPDMINIMMQVRDGTLKHQADEKKNEHEGFATVEESDVGKVVVNRTWNDDEIVAQCFLFFVAGFESISTLLTFASYELAINPDVQQKLYEEIVHMDEQLDGKRINYDSLQKMKYLDQVICESLRKWPPGVQTDRICVKNYRLRINGCQEIEIEKGHSLTIPTFAIHHNPKHFREPERFDPERFNDENKGKILAESYYAPFGSGPRSCIGSRFALMEVKSVLYNLLLHFSFQQNDKTQIPVKLKKSMFMLFPENGIELELKPRKM